MCSWVGFLCVLIRITETGTTNFLLELGPVPLTQRFSTGGDFVPQDILQCLETFLMVTDVGQGATGF